MREHPGVVNLTDFKRRLTNEYGNSVAQSQQNSATIKKNLQILESRSPGSFSSGSIPVDCFWFPANAVR